MITQTTTSQLAEEYLTDSLIHLPAPIILATKLIFHWPRVICKNFFTSGIFTLRVGKKGAMLLGEGQIEKNYTSEVKNVLTPRQWRGNFGR